MFDSESNRLSVKEKEEYFDTNLNKNIKGSVQLPKKGATLEFKIEYYCLEANTNLCDTSVDLYDLLGYICIFQKDELSIKDSKTNKI